MALWHTRALLLALCATGAKDSGPEWPTGRLGRPQFGPFWAKGALVESVLGLGAHNGPFLSPCGAPGRFCWAWGARAKRCWGGGSRAGRGLGRVWQLVACGVKHEHVLDESLA